MKRLVVACFLTALSAPSFAQSAQSAGTLSGPSSELTAERTPSDMRHSGDTNAQGERLICRNTQVQSNSRLGSRRVCHTQAEWHVIAQQSTD